MKTLSLRVDVDTLDGTLQGIPNLLRMLDRHGMQASFYFSLGPDSSGKAIRRIFRPGFLQKMRRTKAGQLYTWRTMMYGVLLPAPIIYRRAAAQMRSVREAGHEVAIHAWDHVQYHDLLDRKSRRWLGEWFESAHTAFEEVFGCPARGAVSPAWRCNDTTLELQEAYGLAYAGDCRGSRAFFPEVGGRTLGTLQVPTTLPTLDELLGLEGRNASDAMTEILGMVREDALNIFALHTEVEGGALSGVFDTFLEGVAERGIRVQTVADRLPGLLSWGPPSAPITRREIPGRAGWVSFGP
nr:polysaccharide deacetylase family protein [uncultured Holophaga sp.]